MNLPIFYYLQHTYLAPKSFDEQASDEITMAVAMETK